MKFAIHAFLLAALLFTGTAVAAPATGVPKAPLAVTLSLSGDMKSIQADVTNTCAESLDVITIHTPLSTDDQGGYQVSDQTRILTFTGLVKAYITTNLSDFHQTIAPGMTVTVLWSLSLVDFANSTGPYYASTSGIFQYLPSNADADTGYLLGEYESNKLQFDNPPPSPRTTTRSNDDVLVYTETCIASKLSIIDAAGADYGILADAGVDALTGGQDTAFAEFFGKGVSATQYRTVTNKFYELQRVKKYANTKEERPITFTFSCYDLYNGCGNNVGAYVKVPEANLYFRPDNDGVYYRGATLLHEFMHLEFVMNSQPLIDETLNNGNRAYGHDASVLLATQNSAKARKNPDNYKYFAEIEYARRRGGACRKDEY